MSRPTLHDDGIGGKGVTIQTFAKRHGLRVGTLTRYCREGKVFGARKHPLTKQWWIYPPAMLLCSPRKTTVGGSTVSSSMSPVIVLV
jgi:hypothetical protein